ncbi:MAG: type II secretion system protein GspE [Desulfuromonas sp.]|nr:MAG: type II secretion system protein GspE [Desulfuromonas sp.]
MKNEKLGEILVRNHLVSEDNLIEALKIQKQHPDFSVGQILVRQGVLSEHDLNLTLDYYGKRKKLGEILVNQQIVTEGQVEHALAISQKQKISLARTLLNLNLITEDQLVEALSLQYDIDHVHLEDHVFAPGLDKYISRNFAIKNRIAIIYATSKELTLAMSVPMHPSNLKEIENTTGYKVVPVLAKDSDITKAHEQIYVVEDDKDQGSRRINLTLEQLSNEEMRSKYVLDHNVENLLKTLLTAAVNVGASDIHLENAERGMSARFRLDGVLQQLEIGPVEKEIRSHGPSLVSKIKIQCDLDITERRRPQDGSFKVQIAHQDKKRSIDFRVSIIPTRYGENVVIRVLDKVRPISLDTLGFPTPELRELRGLLENPTGIILATGPTGSGKTSTLYAALNQVNSPEVKILTVEDPIEYSLGDISQCEVNEKIGNTFAELLRSFLRQDPDFIMVGEMRDLETGSIAIRAALTGHTVLSTLHTNDSTSAITRLVDMEIDPALIATTLRAVIAQRLVRINCIHCREAYSPDAELIKTFPEPVVKGIMYLRGKGCSMCNYTGFSGRKPIIEMWAPNREEALAINRKASSSELRQMAFYHSERKTLLENGLEMLRDGDTTLEELLRNIPSEQVDELCRRYSGG